MDYIETISYIHNTPKFSRVLGNDLLRKLLLKMGNPQKKLKFVHIAGTNGKGSCAIMLAEILKLGGYKTGLFISPYLEKFNERIQINGEPIPDDALAKIASKIRRIIEENETPVSEFALDTAIALEYFRESNCDIVVLETGLGGRLDATNVIDESLVSVLMSIGFDHMQYLGNTLKEIASEKCGIIKENGTVLLYPDSEKEVLDTVKSHCKEKNATLIIPDLPQILPDGRFIFKNNEYRLSMKGDFQAYNAVCAISAAEILKNKGYNISFENISDGIFFALNPGRMELMPCGMYLDGAHNVPAVKELCKELKKLNKPVTLCIAMMQDKDITGYIQEIAKLKPSVYVTSINMPRCCPPQTISDEFSKYGIASKMIENPTDAVYEALKTKDSHTVVASGSLYLVGALRKELLSDFKGSD